MSKKTIAKRKMIRAWHKYYEERIAIEKAKTKGYEELAKVHSAYIAILLNKLGATEDNKVEIKAAEVTEALGKYEVLATGTEKGFALHLGEVKIEKVAAE